MNNSSLSFNRKFDDEAARVSAMLPAGPRLAVIGSTHCHHQDTESICGAVGRALAGFEHLILLTGGVSGVGEWVGKSFYAARTGDGHRGVFHILPNGHSKWDYGETLIGGDNMQERRQILGRLAERYLAIEGGPGTAHEAGIALARPVLVIPVGISGGYSGELFPQLVRPEFIAAEFWRTLGDPARKPEQIAEAVTEIVRLHLRSTSE
jgi:uncharacterized protein (TIGR00725 family)